MRMIAIGLYLVVAFFGVWLTVTPVSLAVTQNTAFSGFDDLETTPNGTTTFRWAGADASVTTPSARGGWAITQITAIAADPNAILTITQNNQQRATMKVQSDTFRRYQTLVLLPVAIADQQTYTLHTSPTVLRDGRSLGVALAAFDIRATHGTLPSIPPLSWLAAIGLTACILAWRSNAASWSVRLCGLLCLFCGMPIACAWAGICPIHTVSLLAGALLITTTSSVLLVRSWMPQLYALERRVRRSVVGQRTMRRFFLVLCLVATGLIISRIWPVYAVLGLWGSVGFVGCLAVYPLILMIRARHIHIPLWVVWGFAGVGTVALLSVYWVIYQRQIDGALLSDLPFHMDDARRLMLGKVLVRYTVWVAGHAEVTTQYGNRLVSIPHPWFHWSIGVIAWLMRDPFYHRALPVTLMLYQLISMGVLAFVMRSITGTRVPWAWIWLVSLLISVVSAVYLPDVNPMIYRGQGSVTIFHNATTIVAKPLSWIALLAAVALISTRPHQRPWLMVAFALLSMLAATLAKPNGSLAIVPALWIIVAFQWVAGTRIAHRIGWLLLPTIAALAVLLQQSTVRSNGGSDFGISWLTVASLSSPMPWLSVLQLTAFPLLTLLLTPAIWRNRVMQTAVLAFAIAVFQYFLFIEPANVSANNFAWGMRIIVPVLYAGALAVLLRDARSPQTSTLRTHLLALILTTHVLSGVLYLVQLLTTSSYL
jgi:hypothetical protein